jgi:hypothetical protein
MALTQAERIFDLAYGAKYDMFEIASTLGISQGLVKETLANLSSGPSSQVSATSAAENAVGGTTATVLGGLRQVANTARPGRSNFDYLGFTGAVNKKPQAVTKEASIVAVPVRGGDVFSEVGLLAAETAGGTMTHQWAALYEGKGAEPVLLAQSVDATNAAIVANTLNFWKLASKVEVTATNCPNGFIYAAIYIAATTIPTVALVALEAKMNVAFKATGYSPPLALTQIGKQVSETTAETPLKTSLAAGTEAPCIVLI